MTEEVNREPGPKGARIPMVMVINARNSLTPPEETALREWLGAFQPEFHEVPSVPTMLLQSIRGAQAHYDLVVVLGI
ncbi:MAG: hypothetical protein A3D26_04200 [Candidatus Blackburnbacteria bacterium RIFCSPHIGHO2_02_FULL_44_20]|uniref:DAGKc domain-containing protein n=1 Tax=Candidatus Blackburnbacteria bacterium RIFCSPHIGHO2_02_FULL_44_20 TaxID=1797516 RepID=A0A1G1V728_9BACT|nr:MAG: hypothetical protein A3E16_03625 [Candidatus Blackburnbacteria bacterium RIFCSPHIGHO2_12_FULL_44_25]OGY11215.1 MAG: hypothetical protein A3D26_04200 [Candidatus Blackburnbacteria bacterium RIFCSPHIGHO2_02_FULL_44_20]OGY14438.1 MAG: hypothetical protein A3A62_00550 [Candidatus Blackburnbacteria bacterium RIFCSPLOWO2_01_FULL_44_43]